MSSELILRAVSEFGPPHARRFAIRDLSTGEYFNGKDFSQKQSEALLYHTATSAAFDMQSILRGFYEHLPLKRYKVPIEIEVYGDASTHTLARWLFKACIVNIQNHQHGNGPRDSLVLPVVHWGLINELNKPMFSLDEIDIEEDDE